MYCIVTSNVIGWSDGCDFEIAKICIINSLLDFDECRARSDDCQQLCVNTQGSFRCECHSGYMLEKDRKACQGTLTAFL